MFTNVSFDLKYALRLFFKSPGYSLVCITVVALSVGLALWSYVMVYSINLKPLPFPGSDKWLSLQIAPNSTTSAQPDVDAFTYQGLLKRNRINYLGAFSSGAKVLSEGQASNSLSAAEISPELLAAMKVAPVLGRLFDANDASVGAAATVILSFDTWQNYFAADPAIVAKQTQIDGKSVRIVGVMPKSFYAFQDSAFWIPLTPTALINPGDSTVTVSPIVVRAPSQSEDDIKREITATIDELNRAYPKVFNSDRHAELITAHLMYTHDNLPLVAMVCFIGVAVLLLGSVNISMVFLARLLERSRELALRTALGSSRQRLLRQCLLESVFVVVLGLVLGIVLAEFGVRWAMGVGDFHAQLEATGRPTEIAIRLLDVLGAIAAATTLWLLSTLVPARRIANQDASATLAGGGKGVSASGGTRSVSILVGIEVLISSLVLVICANVVFAVNEKASKPTGLSTAHVMISTYPTVFGGRYAQNGDRLRYWDELTANINSRIPGAEVAFVNAVPTRPESMPVAIESREGSDNQAAMTLPVTAVSDSYFQIVGLGLRSGRHFDSTDNKESLPVAIVDENTAAHYWPGQDALGKRIQLNPKDGGPWLTIVGVVAHVGGRPYADEAIGTVYQPLDQALPSAFELVVKLPDGQKDGRAPLREAAYAVDRDLPLHNLQRFDEYLKALNLDYMSLVPVFSVIAGITLTLAATGLFGLISRAVARRTQEVGIRRALGGTRWQVTTVFLRQGLVYLTIGVIGGAIGMVVTNLLSASIPDLLSHAALASISVLLLIALVIFTSSYLPTRRAVGLEPGDALRYE